ncbi:gamma-glutamylcyclotransferase family protein [Vibrio metschnikovii]|uniref:gamma-glutamylcyclotransferase family protein n=1 Tax=Vibrio metschnikovii TaxID=28172 RepID=UPI00164B40D5|nr:gamma-glutamylcyclotransferase family protein [Vibrio metschnikovii]MBC5831393.1 gamma-glutamylcyclotransferase [Vibrio metschnikovii]
MYIFGYGSLMNSASRQLTGETGQAIPAIVHGLVRYWGKVDDSYLISPLVVNPGQGQVNGVLLEIDEAGLAEFDRRERGYQRIALSHQQIDCQHDLKTDQAIWVYVTEQYQPPCTRSPIVQTYVDTVLAGCLEVSEAFARHFVEHTLGWQAPWENDRSMPKYGNLAEVNATDLEHIDQLIAQVR